MEQEKRTSRKEIITWTVVALLLIVAFSMYRNTSYFDKERDYYAYFNDVQGLALSSPVQLSGARVGRITEIDIQEGNLVKVTISIQKNVKLPEGTVATLSAGGFTGDKVIVLIPGEGPGYLRERAKLARGVDSSMLPLSARIVPMIETAKFILQSTDAGLRGFNYILNTGMISKTAKGIIKADEKTQGLARASVRLNSDASGWVKLIDKADRNTSELANNSADLNKSIRSAQESSKNLSEQKTHEHIQKIGENISELSQSFKKLNNATTGFGKWYSNKETYHNTAKAIDTLTRNIEELQKDPPGIQIFGKSKK